MPARTLLPFTTMNKTFLSITLACASALSGCASMTPEQCRVADWRQVGIQDGAQGAVLQSQLGGYAEDCGKVGVRPDAARYQQGWDIGMQGFCTPQTGWREGLQGNGHKADRCNGRPQEPGFRRALDAGTELYRTRQKIQSNESEIRRLEDTLQDKKTDDRQRNANRDRIRRLDNELYQLRMIQRDQERMAP